MKVLVTGATGFTGKNLTKHLLNEGCEVNVIVRDKSKLGDLLNEKHINVFSGNIFDESIVKEAIKGVEKVFHVAAIFRTSGITDQVYWDTHVKATEILMAAALEEGVNKFIHTSTVGVHGDVGNGEPADENSPFSPGDIYQITKLEAEKKVHKFYKDKGLPVVVIRPTAIYGPGDLRLLKLFKIANNYFSPIIGKGEIKYHMVYIDDLVQGYMLASEVDEAVGQSFIIGGEEILSLNKLLKCIGKTLGKSIRVIHFPVKPFQLLGSAMEKIFIPIGISPPIYRRRVDFFTKSRAFNISKAKQILKYKPNYSIEEGIKKTADWYRQNGYLN